MSLDISKNVTALSGAQIEALTKGYTDAVADGTAAATAAAVAADAVLGKAIKGTGWTSGMTLKAHDDTIAG
ncbi:MAG TPA: hypothetical protein PLB16_08185, partial [bacterium]|nr:hypothetical protein [bacterium]